MDDRPKEETNPEVNLENMIHPQFMNKSDSGNPNRPKTSKYVGRDISSHTHAIPDLEKTRADSHVKRIDPPVDRGTGAYDSRHFTEEDNK